MEEKNRKRSLKIAVVVGVIVLGVVAYSILKKDQPSSPAQTGTESEQGGSGMAAERLEDLKSVPVVVDGGPIYDGRGGFFVEAEPGKGVGEAGSSEAGTVSGAADISPEELRAQVALRLASLKTQLESLLEKYRQQEIDAQTVSRRLSEIAAELVALQNMDLSSPTVRQSASATLERTAMDLRTMSAEEAARAAERARTLPILLELRVKLYQLSDRMAEWQRVSPALFAPPAR